METSWHESFADRYAEWSAGRTADIPFYAGLAREADRGFAGEPFTGERTEYVFVARHRSADH